MMKVVMILLLGICCSAIASFSSAPMTIPRDSEYRTDPLYPSAIPGTNGRGFYIHAEQIMSISMTAFMMRYDRAPISWQEVVDKGYASERYLMAPDGRMIDPDDGMLDFEFDIAYLYDPIKVKGRILKWWGIINQKKDIEVVFPPSYTQQLREQREFGKLHGFDYWEHVGDTELLFDRNATYLIILRSIWYFHDVNGRYPADLPELFSSGLCPLGQNPISLVTDKPILESSGDTLEYIAAEGNYWLYYLDAEGNRITMFNQPFAEGTEAIDRAQ